MRVVVAVGSNALLRRAGKPDANIELHHVRAAAEALAPLAAEHELIICHGNGPQATRNRPLDVLGARTQGMIGYWLAQSLRNAGVTRPVVGMITQVVVAGEEPLRVVEQNSIAALVEAGTVVICGGGGVAVVDDGGRLRGVEAVVDEDLTASLLAIALRADQLLLLTDVPAVMRHFGTAHEESIPHLDLDDVHHLTFATGPMGPKIEACRRFVAATGHLAGIGTLADAQDVLDGKAGTTITWHLPATG